MAPGEQRVLVRLETASPRLEVASVRRRGLSVFIYGPLSIWLWKVSHLEAGSYVGFVETSELLPPILLSLK